MVKAYNIPVSNFSSFVEKFEKLQRKAAQLGAPVPQFKVVKYNQEDDGQEFNIVEVSGESPKIAGYEFVGTIEHNEHGNIFRTLFGKDIPDSFKNSHPACEYCKKKRSRKDSYIVQKEGAYFQVGRNCIRDFLGHNSPEQIALLESLVGLSGEERPREANAGKNSHHLHTFLCFVIASVKCRGWESSGGSAHDAFTHMVSSSSELKKLGISKYEVNEEISTEADQCIEFAKNNSEKSSFAQNIRVIAQMGYIKQKHLNFAAAIVRAKMKSEEFILAKKIKQEARDLEKAKKRAESANSDFFGKINDRVILKLIVTDKLCLGYSNFGYQSEQNHLIKFKDHNGNIFSWFSTSGAKYTVGESVHVSATIKNHKEFNEIKETLIFRVRLIQESDSNKEAS